MEYKEKFIKINDEVYYESQLRLMSNNQLKELIDMCQKSIEDIADKKEDYKLKNEEPLNSEHFWKVIKSFESASIYLQADIILLSKILKSREPENDENEWYKKFYSIACNNLPMWKVKGFREKTSKEVGFSIV